MSTTTHPFTPEEVMAFVDDELSAEQTQAVSSHIGQCAECATIAANHRGLSEQMTSWRVELAPACLADRFSAGTGEEASMLRVLKRRRSPVFRYAIGIASSLTALVLLLAISIPNLLRSKMAANEASAVGSLRTLNMAAVTYYGTYRHYPPSLKSFGSSPSGIAKEDAAGLIDDTLARGRKSGYLFTYRSLPPFGTYTINADPLEPGESGQRHFSTDQTGTFLMNGLDMGGPTQPKESEARSRGDNVQERAPMIARRAELKVLVEKLEDARQALDRILTEHKGYVAQLSASSESGAERTVVASLRVPADRLDVCIAELKKLGHVTQELQTGEEVTQQHLDLVARLKNSRNTEVRLNGVLQQRKGPVKEILEVERESARVRGEIEQMEAEQQTLEHRVNFATIDLKLAEEYKAQLTTPAPSVAMQLRNATVDGFRSAFDGLLALVLFFAEAGPTLLLWLMILSLPAWLVWRRYRRFRLAEPPLGV